MKIDLTEKQYFQMVKMLYLGMWMATAFDSEPPDESEGFEQYILSFAKESEMKNLVVYDENLDRYSCTVEFEKKSGIVQIINQYDEDVFWHELVHRMAKRDFIRNYGTEMIGMMSIEERFDREEKYIKWYEEEFSANNIENLAIVDRTYISDNNV